MQSDLIDRRILSITQCLEPSAVDFLRFIFKIQLFIPSILHDTSLILEYMPAEQGGWFKSTLSHWHPSALLRDGLGSFLLKMLLQGSRKCMRHERLEKVKAKKLEDWPVSRKNKG